MPDDSRTAPPPQLKDRSDETFAGSMIDMARFALPWRWWWNATVIVALFCGAVQVGLEANWSRLPAGWNVVAGSVLLAMWLLFGAWCVIVVPLLCAFDRRSRWTAPPRVYLDGLRLLVWSPAILMIAGMLLEIGFRTIKRGELHVRMPLWLLIPVLVIIALFATYAIFMERLLARRVRVIAKDRRICFVCGYPLHSITGDRCPECGEAAT